MSITVSSLLSLLFLIASIPSLLVVEAFSKNSNIILTTTKSSSRRATTSVTALKMTEVKQQSQKIQGWINIALSVDGYIAGKDGDIDWLNNQPSPSEDENTGFIEFLNNIDVMIMGRNTFDTVIKFGSTMWAYGDTLPIIVLTRNPDQVHIPDWLEEKGTVSISNESPKELWTKLETKNIYKNVYIDGGKTIQSFLKEKLIRRMILTRVPILLGNGIPLFVESNGSRLDLKHISTKTFSNGMVQTTYDVL